MIKQIASKEIKSYIKNNRSIFYITLFRLIYKIFNPTPVLKHSIFPGQKIIAKLNHILLYAAVLVITTSGAL